MLKACLQVQIELRCGHPETRFEWQVLQVLRKIDPIQVEVHDGFPGRRKGPGPALDQQRGTIDDRAQQRLDKPLLLGRQRRNERYPDLQVGHRVVDTGRPIVELEPTAVDTDVVHGEPRARLRAARFGGLRPARGKCGNDVVRAVAIRVVSGQVHERANQVQLLDDRGQVDQRGCRDARLQVLKRREHIVSVGLVHFDALNRDGQRIRTYDDALDREFPMQCRSNRLLGLRLDDAGQCQVAEQSKHHEQRTQNQGGASDPRSVDCLDQAVKSLHVRLGPRSKR